MNMDNINIIVVSIMILYSLFGIFILSRSILKSIKINKQNKQNYNIKKYRFCLHASVIPSIKHEIWKVFEHHAINLDLEDIDNIVNNLDWTQTCTSHDNDKEGLKRIEEYKANDDWKKEDYKLFAFNYKHFIEKQIFEKIKRTKKLRRKAKREGRKS